MTMARASGFIIVSLLMLMSMPALAEPAAARVQFCWAIGKLDGSVYYASAENREDRSASFAELLYITGIEHHPVRCIIEDAASHRRTRAELIDAWSASELEVIDTTFMSDMDY